MFLPELQVSVAPVMTLLYDYLLTFGEEVSFPVSCDFFSLKYYNPDRSNLYGSKR